MSVIGALVLTFAMLSLLAIGGANATIPEIHRQVVLVHHWMTDATFANLIAIGQTAPGPNVLIVSAIGWQVAGLAGLLAASAAIVVPSSLLAAVVGRLFARHENWSGIALIRRSLTPIAAGLMFASALVMVKAAFSGWLSPLLAVSVTAMIFWTRLSPVWIMAVSALIGIAAHRLHLFN